MTVAAKKAMDNSFFSKINPISVYFFFISFFLVPIMGVLCYTSDTGHNLTFSNSLFYNSPLDMLKRPDKQQHTAIRPKPCHPISHSFNPRAGSGSD